MHRLLASLIFVLSLDEELEISYRSKVGSNVVWG